LATFGSSKALGFLIFDLVAEVSTKARIIFDGQCTARKKLIQNNSICIVDVPGVITLSFGQVLISFLHCCKINTPVLSPDNFIKSAFGVE
jgi:hypothetical protein